MFSLRRKPSMGIPNKNFDTEIRLLIMMWITWLPTTPADGWTHPLEHIEWRISSQMESNPWIKSICWPMYPWQVFLNPSIAMFLFSKLVWKGSAIFGKFLNSGIYYSVLTYLKHGFSNIKMKHCNRQYVGFIYMTRWYQIFW